MGVYGFLVGGTENAAYDNCREAYFNSSSGAACSVTYALDVIPVRLLEAFYMPSLGQLSHGIEGRSFAVTLHSNIFVCYACAWSLLSVQGTTLMEISLSPRGSFTETPRMPMPTPRGGATIVAFGEDLVYVFGGVVSAWPDDHILVHNVSEPKGGSWHHVDAEGTPSGLCDCSGTASHTAIFLMNCLNCTTQQPVPITFTFSPLSLTWGRSVDMPKASKLQIAASNAIPLGQFAVSLWPNGYNSPHAAMYDMVLHTMFNYPVEDIVVPLRHSAVLAVGNTLYFFGGNTFEIDSTASKQTASISLLPSLPISYRETAYTFGEPVTIDANENCISGSETVRLSLTPSCDSFVDTIPPQICAPTMVFNTSTLAAFTPYLWICVTQGSCQYLRDPKIGKKACERNSTTQTACRWSGCCWTPHGECYASEKPSVFQTDRSSSYWYTASIDPIMFKEPLPQPNPAPSWYQRTWFKVVGAIAAALVLYLSIVCVWKQTRARTQRSIESALTSSASFGIFGKKYRVEERIGQGGFGTVFLAVRKSDDTHVAIKYIPCKDPRARDRAMKEYDMAQRVRHPNKMESLDLVVQWSEDVDETDPLLLNDDSLQRTSSLSSRSSLPGLDANKFVCIVMPYYPEGDLRRYTVNKGPLPRATVLSFAQQLCSVLSYLHALEPPIIHRDVKPENILVDNEGTRLVLTDFGMASFHSTAQVTTRAGTLHYAAPETWKKQYSPASDVWSLGCVLYAVSTARITKQNARIMFDDVSDPDFDSDILMELTQLGPELAQVILRMLRRDPSERITSQGALEALRMLKGREKSQKRKE